MKVRNNSEQRNLRVIKNYIWFHSFVATIAFLPNGEKIWLKTSSTQSLEMFEQSFFKVAKTIRNTFRISYQSEKLSQYMDFKLIQNLRAWM